MTSARETIRNLIGSGDPFDRPVDEVRALQLEAARESFAEHRERIPLLRRRADETGVKEIRAEADIVPLLFSHTSYKSYPLSYITAGQWDRLLRWYSTVSVVERAEVDVEGVTDIDDWIGRLAAAGHRLYITSGTSGKVSFLNSTTADRELLAQIMANLTCWPNPLPPERTRRGYILAPAGGPMRSIDGFRMHADLFVKEGELRLLTDDPLRVSELMRSGLLRKKMVDGTATPQEVREFENASGEREAEMQAALDGFLDDIVEHRREPLLIAGMNNQQWALIQGVRARGVPDGEFHPDSLVLAGGGNKNQVLPADYMQQFADFFGDVRRVRSYGMTELQGSCPSCEKGNYHIPPWVVPLVLDEPGERLLNEPSGVVEGRFALLDVSLEGRWGGLISGDRVKVNFSACACGRTGPTVLPDVARYGDLGGDDKINCAATLDSYVRGMIQA
ncbi:hypothetical protein GCM10010191_17810 [Actinomadura vinacea]|uniref:Acyl-protein synthetase LuxE domain-containing protein n=1 Tax=Actinomadura vinacea TaxID=115336 RepID=A0ABP5VVD0_9ACTN